MLWLACEVHIFFLFKPFIITRIYVQFNTNAYRTQAAQNYGRKVFGYICAIARTITKDESYIRHPGKVRKTRQFLTMLSEELDYLGNLRVQLTKCTADFDAKTIARPILPLQSFFLLPTMKDLVRFDRATVQKPVDVKSFSFYTQICTHRAINRDLLLRSFIR